MKPDLFLLGERHRKGFDQHDKDGALSAEQMQSQSLPLTISREELLVDGSDLAFRALVHELFAFLKRHEEIRSGHAHYIGLKGIEYTVLISIAHLAKSGDVNIKTVADHLHLSGAFITTVTNRLLAKGLVDKQPDSSDQRRVMLGMTQSGYALLQRLAPVQRRINDVEFGCLNADDFQRLLGIMRNLVDSSDQALALQRYLNQSA
jgi:DNA-binding MarR family transcriptional regulator